MFGSTLCQIMEQLRPLIGNSLAFVCFLLFILILWIPVHEMHKHVLVWEQVVSTQEAATALNREALLSFSLFVLILCLTFHHMHKHVMFGSTLCYLMDQIRTLTGNPLVFFCFLLIILILCIPVHEMHKHFLVWEHGVSYQEASIALNKGGGISFSLFILIFCLPFHEIHKHFMFGITLCQIMEQIRPLTGNPLAFFVSCFYIDFMHSCSWNEFPGH